MPEGPPESTEQLVSPPYAWCDRERCRVLFPRDSFSSSSASRPPALQWIVTVKFTDPHNPRFQNFMYKWTCRFISRPLWRDVLAEFIADQQTPFFCTSDFEFIDIPTRIEQLADPVPWPSYVTDFWERRFLETDAFHVRRIEPLNNPGASADFIRACCLHCGFVRALILEDSSRDGDRTSLCQGCRNRQLGDELDGIRRSPDILGCLGRRVAIGCPEMATSEFGPYIELHQLLNWRRMPPCPEDASEPLLDRFGFGAER